MSSMSTGRVSHDQPIDEATQHSKSVLAQHECDQRSPIQPPICSNDLEFHCGLDDLGRTRNSDCSAVTGAEPQMLDVIDGLVEKLGDMAVVQAVDDAAPGPGAGNQPERT